MFLPTLNVVYSFNRHVRLVIFLFSGFLVLSFLQQLFLPYTRLWRMIIAKHARTCCDFFSNMAPSAFIASLKTKPFHFRDNSRISKRFFGTIWANSLPRIRSHHPLSSGYVFPDPLGNSPSSDGRNIFICIRYYSITFGIITNNQTDGSVWSLSVLTPMDLSSLSSSLSSSYPRRWSEFIFSCAVK